MIRQAFREESMSRTRVFEWHARFRVNRTSIEDDQQTGRPISSTTLDAIAQLQQLVHEDRHRTIEDLAGEIRIGYGTCQLILTDELGMLHVNIEELCEIPPIMQPSCPGLSLETRAEFTVMTLRQSNNPPNRKVQTYRD
jgi:hypothetical protein